MLDTLSMASLVHIDRWYLEFLFLLWIRSAKSEFRSLCVGVLGEHASSVLNFSHCPGS